MNIADIAAIVNAGGGGGAGGGAGGYDFIIARDGQNSSLPPQLKYGDYNKIKNKIEDSAFVDGAFYWYFEGEAIQRNAILGSVELIYDSVLGEYLRVTFQALPEYGGIPILWYPDGTLVFD